MIFRIKGFDIEITLEESLKPVLTILNKAVFRSVVGNIIDNIAGIENNDIVIEEKGKILKYSKETICFTDYFNFDFNSKSISTSINKSLELILQNELDLYQKVEIEMTRVKSILNEIAADIEFELISDYESELPNLLKLFNYKINLEVYSKSFDKLILMIEIISYFHLSKVIVFINLKSNYTEKEILEIYKCCEYKKLIFLCIESREYDTINTEINYCIDEDLIESGPF
ncbi:MAG: type II-A CRISPR-associated protein Csn2 [Erysipelotrichaceae bacterium]